MRGGGDLASGVVYRLHRAGLSVVITELPQPLVVRRLVSFAEAVFRGECQVEGVTARLVESTSSARLAINDGLVPVLIDPAAACLAELAPLVLVDARMTKLTPETELDAASLVIGLGPGFIAGQNCHAVIETQRGHTLGRVIWEGPARPDTGIPESVAVYGEERVIRAPANGIIHSYVEIGEHLEKGQLIAEVSGKKVHAPFKGVLRGLVNAGLRVRQGTKIGDVDPRDDPHYARLISDKSLAVGGGVLEAVTTRNLIRKRLWS